MDISKLKQELIQDESTKAKPYLDCCGRYWRECVCKDKGKLTVGTGRNLDDVGLRTGEDDFLLMNDINDVIRSLDMAVPYWKGLSDARQRALANMAFELGLNGLLQFRDMLAAIRSGDFAKASQEALDSDWAREVGARAQRIAVQLATG